MEKLTEISMSAACICLLIVAVVVIPYKASRPEVADFVSAGIVKSVEIHQSSLSRSTTVVTSSGSYQVLGSVSAADGDTVQIKNLREPIEKILLCVESKTVPGCYSIL